ncbi:MAG: DUF368 domain-containing protein [Anaerolineae bacterium]|nr:DUF368 domain-containing protein [Anaerolineae bacterium]
MKHLDLSRPRTLRQYARLFLTGFTMGAADIVPGVSGGTIAFIAGIYDTLLNAIKSFDLQAARLALGFKFKELLEHIPLAFLITLGLGILVAIFSLSNLLGHALEDQPVYVFAFFGGLVLASIVSVGLKVKWSTLTLIAMVATAIFAYWLVGLEELQTSEHSLPVLFASGAVAIMAMILPGISGSFILLILGQYRFILGAVRSLDILSLIAVAAGCAVGIIGFSRVLSWLLNRYEQVTVAALVGFMIGSLRRVYMEAEIGAATVQPMDASTWIVAIALLIFGFVFISFVDHLQSGSNPVISRFWRGRKVVPA